MLALFFSQFTVLGLGMGALAVCHPAALRLPVTARFAAGFAVSPCVAAVLVILVALLGPGAPRWLFLAVPLLAGIALLVAGGRTAARALARATRRSARSPGRLARLAVLAGTGLVLHGWLGMLVHNGRLPVVDHDALIYAAEALPFATERRLSAVPDFREGLDHLAPGHPHSYLYQALLAQGLMATSAPSPGFPDDFAMRALPQLTFLCLLAALFAAGAAQGGIIAGCLTIAIFAMAPGLDSLSYNAQRDPFRLIPLVLVAVLLAAVPRRRPLGRRDHAFLGVLAAMAFFSVAGHTLGALCLGLYLLAWCPWMLAGGASLRGVATVLAAVGAGGAVAGLHYVKSIVDTGSPMGYGFAYLAIQGTPLWEAWQRGPEVLRASLGSPLVEFLTRDRGLIVVPAILAGLFLLLPRFAPARYRGRLRFLACLSWVLLAQLVGVFDFTRVKLSTISAVNGRYTMQHYAVFAVLLASVLALPSRSLALRVLKGALAAIALTFAVATVHSWPQNKEAFLATFQEKLPPPLASLVPKWSARSEEEVAALPIWRFKELLNAPAVSGRILVDTMGTAYYLRRTPLYIYAKPAWPVIRAGKDTVGERLAELGITHVLLERDVEGWWEFGPLFHHVESARNAQRLFSEPYGRLYRLERRASTLSGAGPAPSG